MKITGVQQMLLMVGSLSACVTSSPTPMDLPKGWLVLKEYRHPDKHPNGEALLFVEDKAMIQTKLFRLWQTSERKITGLVKDADKLALKIDGDKPLSIQKLNEKDYAFDFGPGMGALVFRVASAKEARYLPELKAGPDGVKRLDVATAEKNTCVDTLACLAAVAAQGAPAPAIPSERDPLFKEYCKQARQALGMVKLMEKKPAACQFYSLKPGKE